MKAKKSLGQNFLIDENIINTIADNIAAFSNDLIIEIGPGQGALTAHLVTKKSFFIAYELDTDLIPFLRKYEGEKQTIKHQDFLTADVISDIKDIKYKNLYIVGNLPYYITTPILERIIDLNLDFTKMVIMVQKEVAERFMAHPGTKDYGYFSCLLQYYFNITKVCDVSKNAFRPIPKVESMVIALSIRNDRPKVNIEEYQEFLKGIFRQKRKTLKNNIDASFWPKVVPVLKSHNLPESIRAEEISEDILIEIFRNIKQ